MLSASFINPAWVALDSSRGVESTELKLFMRTSVLVSEYLIYVPAAWFCVRRVARLSQLGIGDNWILFVAFLMQPATMLVDHGHFQYNTVMQGLALGAISNAFADRLLWCCVLFVAALLYKQMALYFAPVFFAYLLGSCIVPETNLLRFLAIALVTVASFAAITAPHLLLALYDHYRDPLLVVQLERPPLFSFILEHLPLKLKQNTFAYAALLQETQLIHRVFPFARGLFEDKVANLWCAVHTVYKLHHLPTPLLTKAALLLTLLAIAPACAAVAAAPRPRVLLPALAAGAWAFFLCSFQVHEKSVLLPLLPMTLLLADENAGGITPGARAWVGWANALAAWTLYPLLKRDGLATPYAVLAWLFAYLLGLPPASWRLYGPVERSLALRTKVLHISFYVAMLGWHVVEKFVAPPEKKPDLWVVINCVVGAAGFGVCYLWCTWQAWEKSGLADRVVAAMKRYRAAPEEDKRKIEAESPEKNKKKGDKH